jgi:uncharacterized protein (DUF2141 family)
VSYKFYTRIATIFLFAVAPAFASADKAQEVRPGGTGSIEVTVEGLASTDGILFVSLYLNDEGYPGEWQQAYSTQQLPASNAANGSMIISFADVPAGWFVISVLHDADSNSEMGPMPSVYRKRVMAFRLIRNHSSVRPVLTRQPFILSRIKPVP